MRVSVSAIMLTAALAGAPATAAPRNATIMAMASARAATKVDCSKGQTISAAIAALKPAVGYQIINVSGACSDNVYIAPNQAIALNGAKGTTLTPATTSSTPLESDGHLYIYNVAISTGSFAGIFVNSGGYAELDAVTITGPGDGLQVSDHSAALVIDSLIDVTGFAALNMYAGGDVEIDGLAIKGQSGPSLTGGTDGIYCPAGSVTLTATSAPITLSNSGANGLETTGCVVTAPLNGQAVIISGNGAASTYGGGVAIGRGSQVDLLGVSIINNTGYGVNAYENSVATLSGATVTGNTGTALQTSQNAVLHLVNYNGINTITEPVNDTNVLFGCYQGGKIYVDQIAGTIQPPPTTQNQGCLTIGGP